MNKQKKKPKKKISKVDELMAGSQDVEILPDGRFRTKEGKDKEGVRLEPHTFYRELIPHMP